MHLFICILTIRKQICHTAFEVWNSWWSTSNGCWQCYGRLRKKIGEKQQQMKEFREIRPSLQHVQKRIQNNLISTLLWLKSQAQKKEMPHHDWLRNLSLVLCINNLIKTLPVWFHTVFTSPSAQNECNSIYEVLGILLFSCCSLYGHVLYWQPAVQTYWKSSYSAFIGFSMVFITIIPYYFSEMINFHTTHVIWGSFIILT